MFSLPNDIWLDLLFSLVVPDARHRCLFVAIERNQMHMTEVNSRIVLLSSSVLVLVSEHMAAPKPTSHHYYQIAPPINSSKFLSKSSESLANLDSKVEPAVEPKQTNNSSNKSTKMKKSQTALNGFEAKTASTPAPSANSTSILRRRFSLFRIKRPQQQQQQPAACTNEMPDENSNVQALQQIIDQLRGDLQMKTDELETMREHIEKKRSSIAVPSNESIEQAMQLQTMLNARLEEMIMENDLLKRSIYELESYAQQQQQQQSCKWSVFDVCLMSIWKSRSIISFLLTKGVTRTQQEAHLKRTGRVV